MFEALLAKQYIDRTARHAAVLLAAIVLVGTNLGALLRYIQTMCLHVAGHWFIAPDPLDRLQAVELSVLLSQYLVWAYLALVLLALPAGLSWLALSVSYTLITRECTDLQTTHVLMTAIRRARAIANMFKWTLLAVPMTLTLLAFSA